MTLRIEITVPEALVADGTGSAYLGKAMSTLGYDRKQTKLVWQRYSPEAAETAETIYDESGQGSGAGASPMVDEAEIAADAQMTAYAEGADKVSAPKRERGKPGEGRARRTKAEIAEDEAADKADAAQASGSQTGITIVGQTDVSADEAPLISTGEERVGPEDDAETQALDAADEQAEAAANGPDDKPASRDDIRNALGDYVKLFGMAAAQEDGPKVISLVCGDGVTQISKIPDDKVDKALAGVKEMIAKNPFKRTPV